MRVLFVGDIYGKPGRRIASELIPVLKEEKKIDFVVANGENVAGGFGITLPMFRKLERYGVDCITSGNHFWDKENIIPQLDKIPNLLRPANYSDLLPGRGSNVFNDKIGVINLQGRTFMPNIECPFKTAIGKIKKLSVPIIIVDFHAESELEKQALAWYLDGKVSAVLGSHTHVQTADEKILPNGTAYITDAGMTGSFNSVIGVKQEKSIKYFTYAMPQRFDTAKGEEHLNGVIIDIDEESGKALSIKRVKI
ncbi:TIGR00282 family metallophosphoesterase [candidate division WOR-3 bacterium]|nr:TIGR00282 family metallophosphoesterase [candidate division WOR-3 bacterium]